MTIKQSPPRSYHRKQYPAPIQFAKPQDNNPIPHITPRVTVKTYISTVLYMSGLPVIKKREGGGMFNYLPYPTLKPQWL